MKWVGAQGTKELRKAGKPGSIRKRRTDSPTGLPSTGTRYPRGAQATIRAEALWACVTRMTDGKDPALVARDEPAPPETTPRPLTHNPPCTLGNPESVLAGGGADHGR
ncbi:hypothetical protein RE9431_05910 [Prescottella equi]|nr:hypothetical protein RE9431_05910 [Prescottella equi]BCN71988.1 hypothetical protein RE0327_05870 [Prescottella equi]